MIGSSRSAVIFTFSILFVLQTFGLNSSVRAQAPQALEKKHVPGVLLVKRNPRKTLEDLKNVVRNHGLEVEQQALIPELGIYRVHVPPGLLRGGRNEKALAAALKADTGGAIDLAELDEIYEPTATPNDPQYGSQWYLPRISAPLAWDSSTGATSVKVAILDGGVDGSHPDLVGKMVPGWNVYSNNSDTRDVNGHGTMVAGIVAASSNNSIGIAGVAWAPRIMPIRIADARGLAFGSSIAQGLVWAANNGARVANISFSNLANGAIIDLAAQYFQLHNGIVVGAAGLDWGGPDIEDSYILSVNATDQSDVLAEFCIVTSGNYVDIAAPGLNILSTDWGGGYRADDGISYATAIVSGVAALVISANPALSPLQIAKTIKQSALDLGPSGYDTGYGAGLVNAQAAVTLALNGGPAASETTLPSIQFTTPTNGQTVSGNVSYAFSASDNVGLASVNFFVDGVLISVDTSPAPNANYSYRWESSAVPNGPHKFRVDAVDTSFNVASHEITVNVNNVNDGDAPNVSFYCPRTHATTLSGTREVSVRAIDQGPLSVSVTVDGTTSLTHIPPILPYRFLWDTTLVPNGTHNLRVDAVDVWGNSSSFEMPVTIRNIGPDVTPPLGTFLRFPSGETLDDSTPTFEWTFVEDAGGPVTYRLLVDNSNDFLTPEIDVAGLTGFTYTPTVPLQNGYYYWRVSAKDVAGNEEACPDMGTGFEIYAPTNPNPDTTPPPVPSLISPANGAVNQNRTPTFDLSDVADPSGVSYIFELDDNADFSSLLIWDFSNTSNFGPTLLLPGTYYWRVRARDGNGNESQPSSARTLTITSGGDTTAPPAPTLLLPANNSRFRALPGSSVAFDWSDVIDPSGVTYELTVSATGGGIGFAQSNLLISTFTRGPYNLPALETGTYSWQVRARDGQGNLGAASAASTFVVDNLGPAAPALLSPANGSTLSNALPTLDWSDVTDTSGVTGYRLEISDIDNVTEVYKINLPSSTFTVGAALKPGIHFWRAAADDGLGNLGSMGPRFSFKVPGDTTPPPPPMLVSPSNGGGSLGSTPTFVWNPVSDVSGARYRIQIDNSSATFPSPEIDLANLTASYSPATSLPAGTYYWRVLAVDGSSNQGGWSAVWSVIIGQVVSPPIIAFSIPADGFVDALEDKDATSGALLGRTDVAIRFTEPVTAQGGGALTISNFLRKYFRAGLDVSTTADLQTGQTPTVTLVSGSAAGPYLLRFNPRIPLAAWTEIKASNVVDLSGRPVPDTGNRIVIGVLPMDVTQDGRVLGDDISRWLSIKNGLYSPAPLGILDFLDQKRNGIIAGEDITRAIQLINGIGTLRVWTNFDLGPKP